MSTQPNPLSIQIPPNSTGQLIDGVQLTVAGQSVFRENDEIACPVNAQRMAFGPETVAGLSNGTPFVCATVGVGLTGYLSKVKFVSSAACFWTIKSGATILGYAYSGSISGGGSDVYEPPHRFFDQCSASAAFSVVPFNETGSNITVYATAWWDMF